MAIKSQYSNKCRDCGKSYGIGDSIDVNGNKSPNKSGELKDHWCIDGKNCQGAMNISSTNLAMQLLPPKPKDPTPEQFLEIAKRLLKNDTDIKDIDVFVSETQKVTRRAAAKTAIRWASIIGVMDEIGLQHPSRVAFIKDVLN